MMSDVSDEWRYMITLTHYSMVYYNAYKYYNDSIFLEKRPNNLMAPAPIPPPLRDIVVTPPCTK